MTLRANWSRGLVALLVAVAALTGSALVTTADAQDQECSFPFSKVDATGTEVTVEEKPETIVTISPSAAQTTWELGARDRVVGVTKFASYLDGAETKTNVSGAGLTRVVVEKVVALQPDLVLAPNVSDTAKVQQLRDAGLTVYMFRDATSLDDIASKTTLTGQLVGECAAAARTNERMQAKIDTVESAVEGEERPKVVFVLGPGGYVAGSGTFIDGALELVGAENVAATANISFYKQMSPEVLVAQDPEYIVKPAGVPLPKSDAYNQTTAVQEGNIVEVNNDLMSQPAPRVVQPIVTMVKAFHPESYAAANATATPTDAVTDSPFDTPPSTTTPTDRPTQSPTETSSPGFGAVAGLVAVVLALALLRRD